MFAHLANATGACVGRRGTADFEGCVNHTLSSPGRKMVCETHPSRLVRQVLADNRVDPYPVHLVWRQDSFTDLHLVELVPEVQAEIPGVQVHTHLRVRPQRYRVAIVPP